jgi:hypothetical protein
MLDFGELKEGTLPDAVFLYLELFDFHIKRRPRNSEFGSDAIWPSNFSIGFRESRFDQFLLIVLEVSVRGPMTLHLRESTIHEQFDSRDVATIVGCEKHDGFGSLIGRSEPSERNAFGDHLLAFLAHP